MSTVIRGDAVPAGNDSRFVVELAPLRWPIIRLDLASFGRTARRLVSNPAIGCARRGRARCRPGTPIEFAGAGSEANLPGGFASDNHA